MKDSVVSDTLPTEESIESSSQPPAMSEMDIDDRAPFRPPSHDSFMEKNNGGLTTSVMPNTTVTSTIDQAATVRLLRNADYLTSQLCYPMPRQHSPSLSTRTTMDGNEYQPDDYGSFVAGTQSPAVALRRPIRACRSRSKLVSPIHDPDAQCQRNRKNENPIRSSVPNKSLKGHVTSRSTEKGDKKGQQEVRANPTAWDFPEESADESSDEETMDKIEAYVSQLGYTVRLGKDVIRGRGQNVKRVNAHFRKRVRKVSSAYADAHKDDKRSFANKIVKDIIANGGRFLDEHGEELSRKESTLKVMKALKDFKKTFASHTNNALDVEETSIGGGRVLDDDMMVVEDPSTSKQSVEPSPGTSTHSTAPPSATIGKKRTRVKIGTDATLSTGKRPRKSCPTTPPMTSKKPNKIPVCTTAVVPYVVTPLAKPKAIKATDLQFEPITMKGDNEPSKCHLSFDDAEFRETLLWLAAGNHTTNQDG